MGADVVLMKVSRAGTSPRRRKVTPVRAWLTDSGDVLVRFVDRVRGCGQAPMLERIDPYGDLILSPVEMPQLLAELARVRCGGAERRRLDPLRRNSPIRWGPMMPCPGRCFVTSVPPDA